MLPLQVHLNCSTTTGSSTSMPCQTCGQLTASKAGIHQGARRNYFRFPVARQAGAPDITVNHCAQASEVHNPGGQALELPMHSPLCLASYI